MGTCCRHPSRRPGIQSLVLPGMPQWYNDGGRVCGTVSKALLKYKKTMLTGLAPGIDHFIAAVYFLDQLCAASWVHAGLGLAQSMMLKIMVLQTGCGWLRGHGGRGSRFCLVKAASNWSSRVATSLWSIVCGAIGVFHFGTPTISLLDFLIYLLNPLCRYPESWNPSCVGRSWFWLHPIGACVWRLSLWRCALICELPVDGETQYASLS